MKKLTLMLVLAFIFVACNTAIEPNLETNIAPISEAEQNAENNHSFYSDNWLDIDDIFYSDNWFDIDDILYDIDFLVQTLEENFPFMGVVERTTGIDEPLNKFRDTLALRIHSRLGSPQFGERIGSYFGQLIAYYFQNIFFSNIAHLDINPQYRFQLTYLPLWSSGFNPQIDSQPTIIEEGKIAVIPVNPAFFNNAIILREMSELQRFIAEIQGYEHVIIDLTHIGGGFIGTVIETFILPNLSEPLYITEFAFITGGIFPKTIHSQVSHRVAQEHQITDRPNFFFITRDTVGSLVPATKFAEQHNLVNMNQDDLQSLSYGFTVETLLQPTDLSSLEHINWSSRLPLLADNVWLLISPNNGSAGAIFANIAKEAGFTLVGEQTSHSNSGGRAFFELPRTGHIISMDTFYITDNTGRNIEEFPPEPHYFNRPGMDALQTTLAIIAERAEN